MSKKLSLYERAEAERLRDQEYVFGRELLDATHGHEASPEEIQTLTNAIYALFDKSEKSPHESPVFLRGDIVGDGSPTWDEVKNVDDSSRYSTPAERTRYFRIPGQFPMSIYIDPERLGQGFGSGHYDFFPANVENFKAERKTVLRPRNGLRPGKYYVYESVYLDPEKNIADIVKRYRPLTVMGNWLSAVKPATGEELSEVLDRLSTAVSQEDEQYENVR